MPPSREAPGDHERRASPPSDPDREFWWHEEGVPPSIRQSLAVRRLHEEQSDFQQIEVLENEVLGRVLTLDGIVQTTTADEALYHEMLVHVPLCGGLEPRERRRVLIVGGGDGGILREVLRHPAIEAVTLVEIDPRVVEVSRTWLPFHGDFDDPRVELVHADAAKWLAERDDAPPFDAILVDAPDPVGPGAALYARSFLTDASRALAPNGVLARHLGVPGYQPEIATPGVRALTEVFGAPSLYRVAVPTYTGGDLALAVVSRSARELRRPRGKALEGNYYNACIHEAAFALPTSWRAFATADDSRTTE